jgi:hypothetical protein
MHKRGGEEDKSVGKQILTINSEVTHVLCMYVRMQVGVHERTSVILQYVLRQVHSLFQSKFSTKCDLVLPL